jgi:phosphatidylserine/phosphatidylglycerophosphate/cardiolipin synthase-like enzyme
MRQSGSSPQQQALVGVIALVLAAFSGGYFLGRGGHITPSGAIVGGASDKDLSCWFSPKGGCTDAVVGEIEAATKSIQVQSYSFTSHPIANALIDAHRRGVDVTVVADKSEVEDIRSEIKALQRAGVPVYIDAKHAIAHNKVMVLDGINVITGSFNFTHAAEFENADNVLIIHNHPRIASAYADNFSNHLGHSERYEVR